MVTKFTEVTNVNAKGPVENFQTLSYTFQPANTLEVYEC